MKKYERWIVYPISSIGIIIALFALCRNCSRTVGFNHIGDIVGILALLVTVLIGWNIYSAISIKEEWKDFKRDSENKLSKIKNIESNISDLEKRIKDMKEYIKATRNYTIGLVRYMDGEYGDAFAFLCSSIITSYKINEHELLDNIIHHLKNIVDNNRDISANRMMKRKCNDFIRDLSKIDDDRIIDIVEAIRKAYPDDTK